MSDGVEVRVPRVVAAIQGAGGAKVETTHMVIACNALPRVTVDFHDNISPDTGVIKLGGPDIAARVSNQQNAMFAAQGPASTVIMEDGAGNTLTMNGYVTAPKYSLASQFVGFSTTILDEVAAVANLNTSVYTNTKAAFRDPGSVLSEDIGKSLIGVLNLMKEKYNPPAINAEARAISDQVKANNEVASYAIWDSICNASTVVWPELTGLLKFEPNNGKSTAKNILNIIHHQYLNTFNDFWQTIQQFQAMFGMVYVPDIQPGNFGKFIAAGDVTGDSAEDLTLNITSLGMTGGPRTLRPLSYVVVKGPKPQEFRVTKTASLISRWPKEPVSTGQVVTIGTPSWLPTSLFAARKVSTTVGDTFKDTLDLDEYEGELSDADEQLYEVQSPSLNKLLERWAREHYVDFALGESTAEVITDLNLKAKPGIRYNVSSPEGSLFQGFLMEVTHHVSSKTTSLQAFTKLKFTHIEADGFTLPNKT